MNRVTYIYSGPSADAARYLIAYSDLAHATKTTPDVLHHGAKNSTKVELTETWPSNPIRHLWEIVEELSYGDDVTIDLRAAGHLDDANREVLVEALRIALLDRVDTEAAS